MILISHRGNMNGPNTETENNPEFINRVLSLGIYVEVDVWYKDGFYYLGHDEPVYPVELSFLQQTRVVCHAKTPITLHQLLKFPNINCFAHDKDDCVLTSCGWIWTYPGKPLTPLSICVLPELADTDCTNCLGICTDYPLYFKVHGIPLKNS